MDHPIFKTKTFLNGSEEDQRKIARGVFKETLAKTNTYGIAKQEDQDKIYKNFIDDVIPKGMIKTAVDAKPFGIDITEDGIIPSVARGVLTLGGRAAALVNIGAELVGADPVFNKKIIDENLRFAEEKKKEISEKDISVQRKKEIHSLDKEIEDSSGIGMVVPIAKKVADVALNPSEWTLQGTVETIGDPLNYIGGGAGTVLAKGGTTIGGRIARGSVGGAVENAGVNAIAEGAISHGRGQDDESALKSAISAGIGGAVMGAPIGAIAGAAYTPKSLIDPKETFDQDTDIGITRGEAPAPDDIATAKKIADSLEATNPPNEMDTAIKGFEDLTDEMYGAGNTPAQLKPKGIDDLTVKTDESQSTTPETTLDETVIKNDLTTEPVIKEPVDYVALSDELKATPPDPYIVKALEALDPLQEGRTFAQSTIRNLQEGGDRITHVTAQKYDDAMETAGRDAVEAKALELRQADETRAVEIEARKAQIAQEQAVKAEMETLTAHPRMQELIDMRREVSAKESISPNNRVQDRQFIGDEINPTVIGAIDEKNWNHGFALTKADIKAYESGKITPELVDKFKKDLDVLDNDPAWAKVDENPSADLGRIEGDKFIDENGVEEAIPFSKADTSPKLYHVSSNDIDTLENGKTLWTTSDLDYANKYGKSGNRVAYEVVPSENIRTLDTYTKEGQELIVEANKHAVNPMNETSLFNEDGGASSFSIQDNGVTDYLKSKGYDAVKTSESYKGSNPSLAVINPSKVKINKIDSMLSKGEPVINPHSIETMSKSLDNALGKPLSQKLSPIMTTINKADIPEAILKEAKYDPEGIHGFVHEGKAYVVADNIPKDWTKEQVRGLVMHEIGVHLRKAGADNKTFSRIVEAMKKSKNPEVKKAYERVPKDTKPHLIDEEAMAYLVQNNPKNGIAQSIISWVKSQLIKIGVSPSLLKLTPNDLSAMAWGAVKREDGVITNKDIMLMSPVKSKIQKEIRGIHNVQNNGKNSTIIFKDAEFIDETLKYEKGKSDFIGSDGKNKNGFGSLHISKHLGENKNGWVSDKELLNIGTAIRNTEPKIAKNGNRIYQYYNEAGDRFRVIVGNKKDGERIVSFYSNRKAGFGNDSQNYIYNQPLDAKSVQQQSQQSQDIAFSRDIKTAIKEINEDKNIVIKTIKDWGRNNLTMPKGYEIATQNKHARVAQDFSDAIVLHKALSTMSVRTNALLQRYIVKDIVDLPPEYQFLKRLGDNINRKINTMSDELHTLGMLDEATRDAYKNKYIKRLYDEHWFGQKEKTSVSSKGLPKEYMRGKQLVTDDAEQAHKYLNDYAQSKGLEQLDSFNSNLEEVLADAAQKGYLGEKTEGFVKIEVENGKVIFDRDYTKAERLAMGEIENAALTVPNTIGRLANEIQTARMFKELSRDSTIVFQDVVKDDLYMQNSGWIKMPNSRRYGALSEKWVDARVAKDLIEMEKIGEGMKVWLKALSLWKQSKTVWNAGAHVNNFTSNIMLRFLAGDNNPFANMGDAMTMMKNHSRIEDLKVKKTAGLLTDNEILELRNLIKDNPYIREATKIGLFGKSQLQDILQDFGGSDLFKNKKSSAVKALNKVNEFAQKAYQAEDGIVRLSMYIERRKKGMNPISAQREIEAILPDYTRPLPTAIRRLRNSGMAPFISWTYYVLPNIYKLGKQNKWRAFAVLGAPILLSEAAMQMQGQSNADLPTDTIGRRLGYNVDTDGNIDTIKVDRILPGFDLAAAPLLAVATQGMAGYEESDGDYTHTFWEGLKGGFTAGKNFATSTLISGPPVAAGMGALTDKDVYTGRPILGAKKDQTDGDEILNLGRWINDKFVPVPLEFMSTYDFVKGQLADQESRKQFQDIVPRTTGQGVAKLFGVNSMTYDPTETQKQQEKRKYSDDVEE